MSAIMLGGESKWYTMNQDSKDSIRVILPEQPHKGQGMINVSVLTAMRVERVNNG